MGLGENFDGKKQSKKSRDTVPLIFYAYCALYKAVGSEMSLHI
jgi:hypothetical protein